MGKQGPDRIARQTGKSRTTWLHRLGLAACFLAVFLVTGHVFEHAMAKSSANLAACRVCGTLAGSAATDSVQLPVPAGEFILSAEFLAAVLAVPHVRLNSSRAPPLVS